MIILPRDQLWYQLTKLMILDLILLACKSWSRKCDNLVCHCVLLLLVSSFNTNPRIYQQLLQIHSTFGENAQKFHTGVS